MQDVSTQLKLAEESMKASIDYLDDTLAHIRAGKANPKLLDNIKVDYYGTLSPLNNVATVTTPDAKTISVQPWEKGLLPEIEKAIINSDLGITPMNNGEVIRIAIPPLTEERRKQLVKQARNEGEEAKISIRNARRDAIDQVKKMVKDGLPEDAGKDAENEAQKLHDRYIKQVENLLEEKEKEIMTV